MLIYNVPQNTGVVIDSATIASLAAHQKIIGVKDSSGNMAAISETIRRTPSKFSVMTGNGGILYPSLAMGARGAVLAVACAAPRACVDLFEAVKAKDHPRARELQNRLAPLSHTVTARFGCCGLKQYGDDWTRRRRSAPSRQSRLRSRRDKIKAVMRETGLFS